MAYFFPAPFADQINGFRRSIDGLKAGGFWAGAYLNDTFMALLAVEVAATRDRTPAAEVDVFRQEAANVLCSLTAQVRNYVEMIADQAESTGGEDWEDLCGERSAIEVLLTLYAPLAASAAVNHADVERLDGEMRRLGEAYGPVRPDFRLPGIPVTHWWWWYPEPAPAEADPSLSSAIDKALQMTKDRMAHSPAGDSVHSMLASLRGQLEFMRDTVAAGRKPTIAEKNSLTLGVIAVREYEETDPPYCDALTWTAYEFKQL